MSFIYANIRHRSATIRRVVLLMVPKVAVKTGKGSFMLKEFKEFALKGNMVDLAVGIVIGAAFGAIVSSLVDDVFMPVVGLIIGGVDFSALMLGPMSIGLFINAVVKFIIIAFVLFLVVKGMNNMKKKEEAAPAAPAREEVLLAEIRDLLKTK